MAVKTELTQTLMISNDGYNLHNYLPIKAAKKANINCIL